MSCSARGASRRSCRFRAGRLLLCLLMVAAFALPAVPAQAAPSWRITRFDAVAIPEQDGGQTTVVIDFDADFGDRSSVGPALTLMAREPVPGLPGEERVLETAIDSVTSDTGANTQVSVRRDNSTTMRLQIGSGLDRVSGVQSYRLVYRVHGLLVPESFFGDELRWTVFPPSWGVDVSNVSVSIDAPAAARINGCRHGPSLETPCPTTRPSQYMTWRLDHVGAGEGLLVLGGFPAGTFTNADYTPYNLRYRVKHAFQVTPGIIAWSLGIGAIAVGSVLASLVAVRRRSGQTPDERTASTVGSEPPLAEVVPGEMALLVGTGRQIAVTATAIQLAVRGYLRIKPKDPHDPASVTKMDQVKSEIGDLEPFERRVVAAVTYFQDPSNNASAAGAALAARVGGDPWRWYLRSPGRIEGITWGTGSLLVALGLLFAVVLGAGRGWALVPLGLVVAGVLLISLEPHFRIRTAAGELAYQRAMDFKRRLQMPDLSDPDPRPEIGTPRPAGADLFSYYLPYAVALGVADDWVAGLAPLVREGRYRPDLGWVSGSEPGAWLWLSSGSFVQQVRVRLFRATPR